MKKLIATVLVVVICICFVTPTLAADLDYTFYVPLEFGDTGDFIRMLQRLLRKAGYYERNTDGVFGSYTEECVVQFQQDNNLKEDGIAGQDTIEALGGIWDEGEKIKVTITAYCACEKCNGDYSSGHHTKTASGITLKNEQEFAEKYCAATADVGDLGDYVKIDGVLYTIVDRMGAKSGHKIDIFVPSHKQCNKFGRDTQYVTIYN